jgi:RNA polymerase sigma factor (sigma-70 family)
MDDQSIWSRIVSGDVAALRNLHDKYYYQLWLWASKHTHNETLAEELVADCFIKLWERRKHILIEKSLKSYLYLMLRNQMVSQQRKSKKQIVFNSENIPDLPEETTINNQEFYRVKLVPDRVNVTLWVSLSDYSDLQESDFEAVVDLNLWKEKSVTQLPVFLVKKKGFTRIRKLDPLQVNFIIKK